MSDSTPDLDELERMVAARQWGKCQVAATDLKWLIARVRELDKDQTLAESIANLDKWNADHERTNANIHNEVIDQLKARVAELERKLPAHGHCECWVDVSEQLEAKTAHVDAVLDKACQLMTGGVAPSIAESFKKRLRRFTRALDNATEDPTKPETKENE